MKLLRAMAMLTAVVLTGLSEAAAQFPPPPGQSAQSSPFPPPPGPGQQQQQQSNPFPPPPSAGQQQASPFPPAGAPGGFSAVPHTGSSFSPGGARPAPPPQAANQEVCGQFMPIRDQAEKDGTAIKSASERLKIRVTEVRARDLEPRAAKTLGISVAKVKDRLDAIGRAAGRPWSKDQKTSLLAALVAASA